MNKIYLAHAISGLKYDAVVEYYRDMHQKLKSYGYDVLCPMVAKKELKEEMKGKKMKSMDYEHPVSTNHAITERDRWMVDQSDIVFVNLIGATQVSIGCMMELAWGHDKGRHTILAMEDKNIHQHAFVREAADIIFKTEENSVKYLRKLINKRI